MKKKLCCYSVSGAVFVILFGSLAHFLYDWSGKNFLVGLFTPVNESPWEHIKLLFFPMLIYALFMGYCLKREYRGSASAQHAGLLLGCALIPVIYYTYTGILGRDSLVLDIADFVLSTAAAFWCTYRLTISGKGRKYSSVLKAAVFLLGVCFIVFTIYPPKLPLFRSP